MPYPESIEVSRIMDRAASLWQAVQDDLTPEDSYPAGRLEIFDELITREVKAIQGKSGVGSGTWPRTRLGDTARLERNPDQIGNNLGGMVNKLSLTVSDWTSRDWRIEILQKEKPDGRALSRINITHAQRTFSFIPAESIQA